jgi:hypothetical protein
MKERVRLNRVKVQTISKCKTDTPVRTTRAKSRSKGRRSSKNFLRANSGGKLKCSCSNVGNKAFERSDSNEGSSTTITEADVEGRV